MSLKELLFRKIIRLKSMEIDLKEEYSEISKELAEAYEFLSDPTTNLDIVPRETISQQRISLKKKLAKTTGLNRDLAKTYIETCIKEDKNLIRKKLNNFVIEDTKDLINVASCLITIRKIISGMSSELHL